MREPPKIEFEAATAVGIGMTDKHFVSKPAYPHLEAVKSLNEAIHHLIAKHYIAPSERDRRLDYAMNNIEEALNFLGYDVTRRLTASECHEQAIARRVAEDDRP